MYPMSKPLIIRGGTIIDGRARAKPTRADILVVKGRIQKIGKPIRASGATVLDAKGALVTPGFIDVHAHSDIPALQDSSAQGRVFDGVTTELSGTCGLSLFPLTGATAPSRRKGLSKHGLACDWTTAADYFDVVTSYGTAINRGFFVGHGTVRASVVGYEGRRATIKEIDHMAGLLSESFEQGAFGLSSGLCYPPGCFAGRREMTALCKVAAEFGRPYVTHMRSEGQSALSAIRETLGYGRATGVPIQISHLKIAGRGNWWKFDRVMALIDAAKADGVDVAADRYPYLASQTGLATLFPDWLMDGGAEKALARLTRPSTRRKLMAYIRRTHRRKDLWGTIQIARAKGRAEAFEGMTVQDAADHMGLPPQDALFEILIASKMNCSAIYFNMSEDHLVQIYKRRDVMVGSDSCSRSLTGPTAEGQPHPRTFGTFARFLSHYVIKKKLLPLPAAIAKITSQSAKRFGITDRGHIKQGLRADLAIFDPATLRDNATFEKPFQLSSGMRHLLVNGVAVLKNGKETGKRPGVVLRA
jgi:N-acyl-D-amino-acid deacylase